MRQSDVEAIMYGEGRQENKEARFGEALFREWLDSLGYEKKNDFTELTPDGTIDRAGVLKNQYVDVTQNTEYWYATDIDFELSICKSWEVIPVRIRQVETKDDKSTPVPPKEFIQSSIPEARIKHVEIKGGESVYSGGRWTNLQIETISDIKDYGDGNNTSLRTLRGKSYKIAKGIGWWNKNPEYQADWYYWILPVYNIIGNEAYADKRPDFDIRDTEYKAWKAEREGQKINEDDRLITEVPMGLMIRLSRVAIQRIIDEEGLSPEPMKNGKYEAYNIPLEMIEKRIKKGWTYEIPAAIPIVRYITPKLWDGKNKHGSKHFEGIELLRPDRKYYISRRMLYAAYGFTETKPVGSLDLGDRIWIPTDSEEYDETAERIAILGRGFKGRGEELPRDGSVRKLSRIAMYGIESWGELPKGVTQPIYQPQPSKQEEPF